MKNEDEQQTTVWTFNVKFSYPSSVSVCNLMKTLNVETVIRCLSLFAVFYRWVRFPKFFFISSLCFVFSVFTCSCGSCHFILSPFAPDHCQEHKRSADHRRARLDTEYLSAPPKWPRYAAYKIWVLFLLPLITPSVLIWPLLSYFKCMLGLFVFP